MSDYFVHPLADVQTGRIGRDTKIWQFCVVLPGASVGANCNICASCFIENDVVVGDNVTVGNGVSLWDGMRVENDVFIGPNAVFTNDKLPRSKRGAGACAQTVLKRGAFVGANATILPGVTLGENCVVGAGAVVTRSVPPNAIVAGNPACIRGYAGGGTDRKVPILGSPGEAPQRPAKIDTPVKGVTVHLLPEIEDMRGNLTVGNFMAEIPFVPRRYFIVHHVPSKQIRGEHAHRRSHEFLVCVQGTCSAVVDDGSERLEVLLDSPCKGLYVPPMVWGIQYRYSADAALLVFASDPYDPAGYIRTYSEFLAEIRPRA